MTDDERLYSIFPLGHIIRICTCIVLLTVCTLGALTTPWAIKRCHLAYVHIFGKY